MPFYQCSLSAFSIRSIFGLDSTSMARLDTVPQAPEARHEHAAWVWEDNSSSSGSSSGGGGPGGEAWLYVFGGMSAVVSADRRK